MKNIIIIGGGIGGLSAALDLSDSGFNVEIYERNSVCGGQARSIHTKRCSNVYAWRVWTDGYYNFLNMAKRINVLDNLVKLPKYGARTMSLDIANFKSKWEYLKLLIKLAGMNIMSDKRLRKNDITFYDYINPGEQATIDFIDEFVGPIIGMEARKATLFTIARGYHMTYTANGLLKYTQIYVANQPYDDAIFAPWVKVLREKGVIIHTQTPVESIEYDGVRVKSITVGGKPVEADDFILSLDQTAVAKLFTPSPLSEIPLFSDVCNIHKIGNELYFGFMLYFSEKFANASDSFTTYKQPWKPVIQNYSTVWTEKARKKCDSVELLQVSCLNLVAGYNGKTLQECSVDEAFAETMLQLRLSDTMNEIRTVSGKNIWEVMDGYEIWPYWATDSDGHIYNTLDEYKLSINSGVYELMPTTKTPVPNLYFGSVMARTDVPMVSMEVACTAGRNAAGAIAEKYGKPIPVVYKHPKFLSHTLKPFRIIDSTFSFVPMSIIVIFLLIFLIWIFVIIHR